jgi:hypothetical protein
MSQEDDKTSPADLAPAFQAASIPKISVPDLSPDAEGLSAEALAQVPTLTEQVDETPGQVLLDVASSSEVPSSEVSTQDLPLEADTKGEELQVRMGKLTGDIQTLNARLDRLEESNHTKA